MLEVGDLVKINFMKGESHYTGRKGVVTHIDDIGQVHGTWGGCAIIPDEDDYKILEKKKEKK
jgi:hypothetical protein